MMIRNLQPYYFSLTFNFYFLLQLNNSILVLLILSGVLVKIVESIICSFSPAPRGLQGVAKILEKITNPVRLKNFLAMPLMSTHFCPTSEFFNHKTTCSRPWFTRVRISFFVGYLFVIYSFKLSFSFISFLSK